MYNEKILPLEEQYHFHELCVPRLMDQDFDAKPTILLIGQYSTGKTTFIKLVVREVGCENSSSFSKSESEITHNFDEPSEGICWMIASPATLWDQNPQRTSSLR